MMTMAGGSPEAGGVVSAVMRRFSRYCATMTGFALRNKWATRLGPQKKRHPVKSASLSRTACPKARPSQYRSALVALTVGRIALALLRLTIQVIVAIAVARSALLLLLLLARTARLVILAAAALLAALLAAHAVLVLLIH
jgi:hypothetical protein